MSGVKRRRVVFLTDVITPYMVAVMEALSERVELTALFCSERGTRSAEWAIGDLAFPHRVLGGLTLRRSHADATDFYVSSRIPRALFQARPEGVVSGGFSFPTLYAAGYCAARSAGLVIHSDGTSRSEAGFGRPQRVARRVLLRAADVCAANSEPAAERFVELGFPAERVFRALHTTGMEPFWAVAGQSGKDHPPLRVVTVGRLIERKGVDRLIRAVGQVRSTGRAIELDIVGSGPEEGKLRELATAEGLGDHVHFRGFVDQTDLPDIYGQSDAFAFPTLNDPFGIVLLEAAAAGMPLLASTGGGATQDLVQDGVNGYAYDPDDAQRLTNSMIALADDADLRRRMGAAAHESTLDRTPATAAGAYAEAVEAAIAVRKGRKTHGGHGT